MQHFAYILNYPIAISCVGLSRVRLGLEPDESGQKNEPMDNSAANFRTYPDDIHTHELTSGLDSWICCKHSTIDSR